MIAELYPISLRDTPPVISIPFAGSQTQISKPICTKFLTQRTKMGGSTRSTIAIASIPLLDQEDAKWADKLLKKAAKRRPSLLGSHLFQ